MVSFEILLPFVGAAAGILVAIGVTLRNRGSLALWTFVAGMTLLALGCLCDGLSINATPEFTIHWQQWRMNALSLVPGIWLLFSICYARGNADVFLTRWRLVVLGAFLLPVGLVVWFQGGLISSLRPTEDEQGMLRLGWPGLGLHLILLIGSVLILTNLERTLRASFGTLRWRIKFMLLGVGLLFVTQIYTATQVLLFGGIDLSHESVDSGALLLAALLVPRALFRKGHFDRDVYPSQAVLQGSLTILLAGIYLVAVGIFAKIVTSIGGDGAFALKAFLILVALVGLPILLQSDRLRLGTRRWISRNFHRPLYDYHAVWKQFTEGTASKVEPSELCHALVKLVSDIFQALSVAVWQVDNERETFVLAASTLSSSTRGETASPDFNLTIAHFRANPKPADIEFAHEPWAAAWRTAHPSQFPNGGNRVCIPMVARGELLGLLVLGDRVAGVAFSLNDLEMLKCVGEHAGACLLNAQLSQKLLQAKELEAFRTMAAFFVHDLKNAASTLNLTLQNLPAHFEDPAFRADALRAYTKSVEHINHLVRRLSALRHESKIQAEETDLNSVLAECLAAFDFPGQIVLTKSLNPIPNLWIDADQIAKVFTNLFLNAREAISGEGEVSIATAQEAGSVVVTVSDSGRGMSREFIQNSLFRPFQTTKKNGLGIGMFQTKTILEGHGGRITVVSSPDRGTTFRVFLPVARENSRIPSAVALNS